MAQGTGRHGHKDSKEPYPHTKGGGGQKMQASSRDGGGGSGGGSRQEPRGSGGENLQSREYRDAQGNIHHHTKTYMEQHGKDRGR